MELAVGAGLAALSHPVVLVKLLVQVDHEPLAPTPGTNLFGRKVLYLPGFFTYVRHIVHIDGKSGLFRGLTPRILSNGVTTVLHSKVKQSWPMQDMGHYRYQQLLKSATNEISTLLKSAPTDISTH